jgi:ankyrin repeat protein
MLSNSRGFSLSHLAAEYKNEKILSMLIDAGADLTVVFRNVTRATPFLLAAANPNAAVIALLIPLSDLNATDAHGTTACMRAANSLVLELLIDAGANVNAAAGDDSALTVALKKRDEKMVEILVDAGADVNKFIANDRWTAMHLAVEWCNHGLLGNSLPPVAM